jgi:hypothetical protein
MAKHLTVFYSWQSDTPSNLNRSFIEKSLIEALKRLHSDATLENALRDTTVELDKDTKGVAGSPPIADTILKKIEECAVFVADFTFVGESMNGLTNTSGHPRLFPNPNVLIEYGYALRCHSHAALVGIMNSAFGKPSSDSLPFDLRHLRWPITYHLADASDPGKPDQFERLVETLVNALRLILSKHSPSNIPIALFTPQKSTKNPAIFFEDARDLIPQMPGRSKESYTLPNEGLAYLRLYPTATVPVIETELDAETIVSRGGLIPIGRVQGWCPERNIFGGIVYESARDGQLNHFTQLFLTRELWGLDALCVNASRCRQFQEQHLQSPRGGYIASGYVEEVFVKALGNYLHFAQAHLGLPLPLRVEAGLVGIKGYSITVSQNGFAGSALHDQVQWQGEVLSYEMPSYEILEPFFNLMWAKCGVRRPASIQAERAKRIAEIS